METESHITAAIKSTECNSAEIRSLSASLGFAAFGCAKAEKLTEEEVRYSTASNNGFFADMGYLSKNTEMRYDPRLLVPGAKSVLVFLAPFGGERCNTADGLKISEYALGLDYHRVIKGKLHKILEVLGGEGRVFTDSAPILERAWAVKAGLGFIGKNNFLISPECGIKNFIGIIASPIELSYNQDIVPEQCGACTRCLEACSRKALCSPHCVDARKCLSYKTIEEKVGENNASENITCRGDKEQKERSGWIFGCDDCMNACPWNSRNAAGWPEFRTNEKMLSGANAKWWNSLTESEFKRAFSNSPLSRAGLEKIKSNCAKANCKTNLL